MNKMKKMITEKMGSDKAAVNTVEMIILIALGVFAALALYTFVLRPTQESADQLGKGIKGGVGSILESNGNPGGIDFSGKGAGTGQ